MGSLWVPLGDFFWGGFHPETGGGLSGSMELMKTDTPTNLTALAAEARPDRDRAVDAYRAGAMLAVALGHWAAVSIALDDDRALMAGNALAGAPIGSPHDSAECSLPPSFWVEPGLGCSPSSPCSASAASSSPVRSPLRSHCGSSPTTRSIRRSLPTCFPRFVGRRLVWSGSASRSLASSKG
jgi:hypothetical protein